MAAAALMQQARIAIREGRLVDARRLLRQVIHEEPQNHAAWLLLARTTPDKKLAAEYIERARYLQPDSPLVQRAQDDLAANKTAVTSKFSYRWLLLPILVGAVLVLGLAGVSYGNSALEQVGLTANQNIERVAAAPEESTEDEPARVSQTISKPNAAPDTNSPQVIPTDVAPSPVDTGAVAEPGEGEIEEAIFEPVVISGSDQALPPAILMGIDTEASSREEVATTTEEAYTSPLSREEIIAGEERDGEIDSEAETIDGDAASNGIDPDDVAEIDEAVQNLEEIAIEADLEEETAESSVTAEITPEERWIDVNLTTQTLTAYEGETPVLSSLISSGMWQFPTVTGQFRTWIKYDSQDMTGYHLGYNYSLDDVPHVMYFFEDYAIHGAYWHNNFGTPMSHGCVNVNLPDAEWLYNWAPLGTLVNVHH